MITGEPEEICKAADTREWPSRGGRIEKRTRDTKDKLCATDSVTLWNCFNPLHVGVW